MRINVFANAMLAAMTHLAVRTHAAAAVDQTADGDGSILAAEKTDGFRFLVLKQGKASRETADISTFPIADGDMQQDQLRL